jgi:TolA-binding protein
LRPERSIESHAPNALSLPQRLSLALRTQLAPDSLAIIAIGALLYVFASMLIFAFVFQFLALTYVFRNASGILHGAMHKRDGKPTWLSLVPENQGHQQTWLFLLLLASMSVIARQTSGLASGLLYALLAMIVPAATILVVVRNSLADALNPINWLGVMLRLGLPYFTTSALLALSAWAFSQLKSVFIVLPYLLANLLSVSAAFFLLFVSFHLLGQLIGAFELEQASLEPAEDLAVDQSTSAKKRRVDMDPELAAMSDFYALIEKGRHDDAVALMHKFLSVRGGSREVHERFRAYLTQQQRPQDLLTHGALWLHALLAQGADSAAVKLYMACRQIDTQFKPQTEQDYQALAQALAQKTPQWAETLLADFAQRFPNSKLLPTLQLMRVDLLQARDPSAATALLQSLQQRFPEHPHVRAYVRLGS